MFRFGNRVVAPRIATIVSANRAIASAAMIACRDATFASKWPRLVGALRAFVPSDDLCAGPVSDCGGSATAPGLRHLDCGSTAAAIRYATESRAAPRRGKSGGAATAVQIVRA
jgi:hypothetical protein